MKRRHFGQVLAGASLWPLAAHAQGSREAVKIGFVYPGINQLVASRIDAISAGIRAS